MNERTLGRTGLRVSEIGLGTWAFASAAYGDVAESDAHATVRAALDAGIAAFDTAPLYGAGGRDGIAEEVLGRALGADRDRVLLLTKFGRNPRDGCRPAFHAERARTSIDQSLRRLKTDRIDVLFFHSPFSPDEIHDDIWAALAEAKAAGKIRFVGHSISMFAQTEAMARTWAAERKIDVVQTVYSLLNRESERLIADLAGQGIGVVARETLANGWLCGAFTQETVFPKNNLNSRYTRAEIAERVDYVDRLRFLVRGEVRSLPQAALRWALDNPGVSLVLTGAKSPAELADAVAASAASPFAADERERARALHAKDFAAA